MSVASFGVFTPTASAAELYSASLTTAVRQLPVAAENNAGYDRDRYFGDWVDADGDCQNTRHEVLIAESQVAPALSSSGCTVTAGQWTTFYDDRTYTSPGGRRHRPHGAGQRGMGLRRTGVDATAAHRPLQRPRVRGFAQAIVGPLNSSKSDRGPEEWLPPANVCRYIAVWTAVKIRWSLTVDPIEQAALIRQADACPATTVTVETVDLPSTPTPPAPPAVGQPTQIAVTARTIDYGSTVGLAVLGEAGAVVDLYAGSARTAPRVIRTATLTAGGTGNFNWTLQPGEITHFFAQVRGGDRSDTITVNVRRTVTIGIRQAAGVYTFTRVVNRPVAGLQVTLARLLTTGRVVGVASTRTDAAGKYTIRTRLAPGLSGYYALTADVRPAARTQPPLRPRGASAAAGSPTPGAGHSAARSAHCAGQAGRRGLR
ncbi:MAG: hypothetical protein M3P93_05675 [Actinomycetota bacterium]|nr:hypothetical protein [Actinomycetota bacterium]